MATLSYHEQKNIENTKKLRTSVRTRIAYAHDLKIFFQFLKTANPRTFDNPAHTLTPGDLEKLTVSDLEEYIDYLKCRQFVCSYLVPDDFFTRADMMEQIEKAFRQFKRFADFINYTIDDFE